MVFSVLYPHYYYLYVFGLEEVVWRRGMTHPGYIAIANEAERLGWPVTNKTDLMVDYNSLERKPGVLEFGWAIAPDRTDIFFPGKGHYLLHAKTCKYDGVKRNYYWVSGEVLMSVSLDTLIRKLEQS